MLFHSSVSDSATRDGTRYRLMERLGGPGGTALPVNGMPPRSGTDRPTALAMRQPSRSGVNLPAVRDGPTYLTCHAPPEQNEQTSENTLNHKRVFRIPTAQRRRGE